MQMRAALQAPYGRLDKAPRCGRLRSPAAPLLGAATAALPRGGYDYAALGVVNCNESLIESLIESM